MNQNEHLRHTKEQLEYSRVDKEYEFVKKRALVNFLTNQKLAAESNFHTRSVTMLNQIASFENANMKKELKDIAIGSVDSVFAMVKDPAHEADIQRASFLSALAGIKKGVMTYENDPILPLIQEQMESKLAKFQGLSSEEESKLLSLTPEQRGIVVENDRKIKNEFLGAAPAINHGSIKMSESYK